MSIFSKEPGYLLYNNRYGSITQLERDLERIRLTERLNNFTTLPHLFKRLLRERRDSDKGPIKTLWYPGAEDDLRPLYYFNEPELFVFTSLNKRGSRRKYLNKEIIEAPHDSKANTNQNINQNIKVISHEVIYHNRSEYPFMSEYAQMDSHFYEDPHEQGNPDGYLINLRLENAERSVKKTLIYLFQDNIHFLDEWIVHSGFFTPNALQLHTFIYIRNDRSKYHGDRDALRNPLSHWLSLEDNIRQKHTPKYIIPFQQLGYLGFQAHNRHQSLDEYDRYLQNQYQIESSCEAYHHGVYRLNNALDNALDNAHDESLDVVSLDLIDEHPPYIDRDFIERYDWSCWSSQEILKHLSLDEIARFTPQFKDDYLVKHFTSLWSATLYLSKVSSQSGVDRAELIELLKRRTLSIEELASALSCEEVERYLPQRKEEYCIFKLTHDTPSKFLRLDSAYTAHLIEVMRARRLPLCSFMPQLSLEEVQRHLPDFEDEYIISKLSDHTPSSELLTFEGQGSDCTQALVHMLKKRTLNDRFPVAKLKTLDDLRQAFIERRRHCAFPLLKANFQLTLRLFEGLMIRALNLRKLSAKKALLVLQAITPRSMLQLPSQVNLYDLNPQQLSELRTLKCIKPIEGTLDGVNRLPHVTRLQLKACPISELEALRSSKITELALEHYQLTAPLDLRGLPNLERLILLRCSPVEAHTEKPVELVINPQRW